MTNGAVSAAALGSVGVFAGLGERTLSVLAGRAERRLLADNQTLFEQGAAARELYAIVKGRLSLRVADGERSTMVQSVEADDLLGWSALRENPHWLTTARAVGPVEVIAIPLAAVLDAIEAGGPDARRLTQRLFGVGAAHLDAVRAQLQPAGREPIITGG